MSRPTILALAQLLALIDPTLERAFAKKLYAKTTVLQTSHVPMLSQPGQVAEVIIAAAGKR